MLRGCKDEQERQQLENLVLVESQGLSSVLEDEELPDWMRNGSTVPTWFNGGENPGGAKA